MLIRCLILLDRAWRSERVEPLTRLAVLAGLGGLLSPAVLPTVVASIAAVIVKQRKVHSIWPSTWRTASIVCVFLLPWCVRNEIVMGSPIITRSNFGLELATGNAAGANGQSGSGTGNALHPHDSLSAAITLRRVGEVAYMREMIAVATSWIETHPVQFLRLTARRVILSVLPAPDMFDWVPLIGARVAWICFAVFGLLKLASLAEATLRRDHLLASVLYCVLPSTSYFITHINLRYEFLTYFTWLAFIMLLFDRFRPGGRAMVPSGPG